MSVRQVKQDSQESFGRVFEEELWKGFRKVLEEILYFQHLQRNIYSNTRNYIFVNIHFLKWISQINIATNQ